jgi:hypothetical protein
MPKYDVEFAYKTPEFGLVEALEADNIEHAEELAEEHVRDMFESATDIEITSVRELA